MTRKKGREALYTVILEYEDVNSVSQFSARDPKEAFQKWFAGLSVPNRHGLTARQASALASVFDSEEEPQMLAEVENVFCVIEFTGRKPARKCALVNIVQTCSAVPKYSDLR